MSTGAQDSERESLRNAYCPPLDDALFHAIASEYELPKQRDDLVAVLDNLKVGALEQQTADFDPSGTGGASSHKDAASNNRSCLDDSTTYSNEVTSIATTLSDLRFQDIGDNGEDLENAPTARKIVWLANLFPDIPRRDLASILESHQGRLDSATDELLNLSFLRSDYDEEIPDQTIYKGVDGFAEGVRQSNRKGRGKKKQRGADLSQTHSGSSHLLETQTPPSNVWSSLIEDVEFICSRTTLKPQAVRSVYHACGSPRLSNTIRHFAVKEGAAYSMLSQVEPVIELQLSEFQSQFPEVPKYQLYGLLALCRRIPSAAQELLEAMTAVPDLERELESRRLDNVAQYAPVSLGQQDSESFEPVSNTGWSNIASSRVRVNAASQRMAANQSFSQASAAYKRGKSDRLMAGAAAYYSAIGREQVKMAKELHAAEADALVASQSSATVLDLHGVSVQDAVRISSNMTQNWYEGLGDAKYTSGGGGPVRAGFKIITGVGSHSKNHAPRIGPAVSKMLIREGWKVEIGHGELIVTGKVRK